MRTYVIAMVALMAWDLLAKMLRLYLGKTSYTPGAVLVDGLFCAGFLAWGIWVLANASA